MKELIIVCPEAGYELYNSLSVYFDVEIVNSSDDTMGIIDYLNVLMEPISKTVEIIGNIILELIKSSNPTITIKNGDKEVTFSGKIKGLNIDMIMEMLNAVFEG